jgi:hypothetical protein
MYCTTSPNHESKQSDLQHLDASNGGTSDPLARRLYCRRLLLNNSDDPLMPFNYIDISHGFKLRYIFIHIYTSKFKRSCSSLWSYIYTVIKKYILSNFFILFCLLILLIFTFSLVCRDKWPMQAQPWYRHR